MLRVLFVALSLMIAAGCQTASAPNANTVSNTANQANQANIPPEFQTRPIAPNGTPTPGIPDPSQLNTNVPVGASPTPGIPPANSIGKTPVPKGATPTPGIPSEDKLREQMSRPVRDANAVNRP